MTRLLPALLIAALSATGHAQVREPVDAGTGELPVILTAPHGGTQAIPGCEERTAVGSRFVTGPDRNTDLLARGIADEQKRLTGKAPYLVIARFHRKYIDANGSAGAPAVTGPDSPDSVFGRFATMGYAILPAKDTAQAIAVFYERYLK